MKKILEFLKKGVKFAGIPALFSFIGAMAGSEHSSKGLRRFGLPGIVLILAFIRFWQLFPVNLWFLTIMLQPFVYALGHGIPDASDPKPSVLGKFFYNLFKGNHLLADIFTRGTIGLLLSVTLLSIPILTSRWIYYLLSSVLITISWATLSWQDLGSIKMGKYTLCNSDLIVYGIIGYAIYLLIFVRF